MIRMLVSNVYGINAPHTYTQRFQRHTNIRTAVNQHIVGILGYLYQKVRMEITHTIHSARA